jgi:hypothetical protein
MLVVRGGDEALWVRTHISRERSQGNSLQSYLKQTKMSFPKTGR